MLRFFRAATKLVSHFALLPSLKGETDRCREFTLTLYRSMSVPWSVFLEPRSISHELGRLVQDQLPKLPCPTSSRRSTLDDLEIMVETLSTLTSTSTSVLEDISAREQDSDPFTALEEIGNVLTWTKCSFTIRLLNVSRNALENPWPLSHGLISHRLATPLMALLRIYIDIASAIGAQ